MSVLQVCLDKNHVQCDLSASLPGTHSIDCTPSTPRCSQSCRLCWSEDKNGLVCPCKCSGSIQWIHVSCLQQWQRTLWHSGQYARALHCDVCQQPYDQLFIAFPLEHRLPVLGRFKQLLLQLYRNPELAFKAWRCCIMLGGLAAGTHRGMTGFKAGLAVGIKGSKRTASWTLRLMPQLSIVAAVLPSLQPLLRNMLRCSCAVMAAEVALASAAGLLCGGLLGFCLGTIGVVRLTAQGSCHAASLAALLAGKLTANRQGAAARAAAASKLSSANSLPTALVLSLLRLRSAC